MTLGLPPVPDAPNLPPWIVAITQYEGRYIILVDESKRGCRKRPAYTLWSAKPEVVALLKPKFGRRRPGVWHETNKQRALAAFQRIAEGLLARDES